jgi:hypothetical protein
MLEMTQRAGAAGNVHGVGCIENERCATPATAVVLLVPGWDHIGQQALSTVGGATRATQETGYAMISLLCTSAAWHFL